MTNKKRHKLLRKSRIIIPANRFKNYHKFQGGTKTNCRKIRCESARTDPWVRIAEGASRRRKTRRNFEKLRRGREKKQEEGTQLAPGRVVALSSNRPCTRGPWLLCVRTSCAQKNSIARALVALACVATPNDISRRRHAGARLPRSATRRGPAGQQKERSEIPRAWN